MACFNSISILLIFLVSLPLQLLAIPIPYEDKTKTDIPQIHAPAIPAASEQPTGSTSFTSSTTSTSSETTNVLSGNKLGGIGNVAGNNLFSNNKGNNLASGNSLFGDVNIMGEQSKSADTTTTYTTLIISANGGKAQ